MADEEEYREHIEEKIAEEREGEYEYDEEEYKEKTKERLKEKEKEKIEKEKTEEEAWEKKKEAREKAEAESELEQAREEGMAKSVLKKGAGAIGGAFSAVGGAVKSVAEKGIDESGKPESREALKENVPKGQSMSDLSDKQKQYFLETGKWPRVKVNGKWKMTQDYYEWREGGTSTRSQGVGGLFGSGRAGREGEPSRPPISVGRERLERHPLESRSTGEVVNVIEQQKKGDVKGRLFDERVDQTDSNPFKLSKGEEKPNNPFDV